MTDQPEGATLGAVLDALVAGMTTEQFDGLAQRTGHRDGKQHTADTLARYARQENTAATADAALKRHSRSR